jgi:DUF2933 family protein
MTLQHQHEERAPHESGLKDWLASRTGIATCVAVSVLAFLIATGHSAHLMGMLPYLLLLACPLMHVFLHGGRGHHHHHREEREE